MFRKIAISAAAGVALTFLAGCSGQSAGWEWTAAEDAVGVEDEHHYFQYPTDSEFEVGDRTAVVRISNLKHNELVPKSDGAEEWVYTPAVVTIVEPGSSGLNVGDSLTIAIPGGSAEGVDSSSVWVFDKAKLSPGAKYLVSWAPYDYPNFTLDHVMEYIYEANGKSFVRLQSEPDGEKVRAEHPVFASNQAAEGLARAGKPKALVEAVKSDD